MSKLDIWELLGKIDSHDQSFLKSLKPEEQKGFVPIVTLRWLSGSGDPQQLIQVNELVNSTVFNLYKHPELLYRLMVAASPRGKKNYNYIKTAKKAKTGTVLDVLERYLNASPREAREFVKLYTPDEIIEMAESLGETTDFMKTLKSELK